MAKGKKRLILSAFSLAWFAAPVAAQSLTGTETALSIAMPGESAPRAIWVSLPPGYDQAAAARYPVAYVLDGRGLFPAAVASARFLSLFEGAPGMIVVGVDSVTPAARRRDLTPVLRSGDAPGVSGEAARFAEFLTRTVMAQIDREYRTNGSAVLIGHSLAGLFVLDRWQRGSGFDGYIAISPTLPWAENEIMARIESGPAAAADRRSPFVFVSMAADTEAYLDQMKRLEAVAAKFVPAWQFARFPEESHVTTVPGALFRGLTLYQRHRTKEAPQQP